MQPELTMATGEVEQSLNQIICSFLLQVSVCSSLEELTAIQWGCRGVGGEGLPSNKPSELVNAAPVPLQLLHQHCAEGSL